MRGERRFSRTAGWWNKRPTIRRLCGRRYHRFRACGKLAPICSVMPAGIAARRRAARRQRAAHHSQVGLPEREVAGREDRIDGLGSERRIPRDCSVNSGNAFGRDRAAVLFNHPLFEARVTGMFEVEMIERLLQAEAEPAQQRVDFHPFAGLKRLRAGFHNARMKGSQAGDGENAFAGGHSKMIARRRVTLQRW